MFYYIICGIITQDIILFGDKMKLYADYKIENGYKRISIWDIYNGYHNYVAKEGKIDFDVYYRKYYKNRLFSTHNSTKIAMVLVRKKPYYLSSFRYLGNINCNGKLESITHSTYKEIIKDFKVLNLRVGNRDIKLYVSHSDIEVGFTANGNNYYADVFIDFYKSEPSFYYYKWNGKICFEINYSHSVEDKKVNDCFLEGIAIFEHTVSNKLSMREHITTEEEVINQKNFIAEKLSTVIYGKLLSDPVAVDYKNFDNLIKENIRLETQYRSLLNDNKALLNANNFQSNKIIQLEQNVLSLEKYKNKIENHKFIKFIIKLFGIK